MHRDKKKEIVEAISETFPEFLTRAWGPDGPSNTALMALGILAKRKSYKRLLITVTDADTGEEITRRQTFQQTDDIPSLVDRVIELAVPPDELVPLNGNKA